MSGSVGGKARYMGRGQTLKEFEAMLNRFITQGLGRQDQHLSLKRAYLALHFTQYSESDKEDGRNSEEPQEKRLLQKIDQT